jgi:D-arabinose 1-dehydrogenase-like Zn-dependent alcohol dehydrogenase
VGVVGLGGLGHMAVKFGVAFGCEVYVISRNRNKEEQAKAMGAKAVIPSGDAEEMKKAAGALAAGWGVKALPCMQHGAARSGAAAGCLPTSGSCLNACPVCCCSVRSRPAGTLDAIIDTVSAEHGMNQLLDLLAPRGKLIMVGLPPKPPTINHFNMVLK